MLLSTPPNPQPHPHPRGCSVPTSQSIGLVGDLRTLSQPKQSFLSCFGWRAQEGGYFTKLVSIQIANFHMVLADQKKCTCGHWVSADNLSAWLMPQWFFITAFPFSKGMNRWMTSFNRPCAGLHVKVIRLPPAYGNVLAVSLLFNFLVQNNRKALWIRFLKPESEGPWT